MKTGKSLTELAAEIERQAESKKDYIAPAQSMGLVVVEKEARFALPGIGDFGITPHAHGQLAEYAGIPKAYYDRMKAEDPDLLARNVNRWVHAEKGKRMVRTLDGDMRGLMSDRFRALDNYDLADAVFPVLKEAGAVIASADITTSKFYLKCLCPWLDRELPVPPGLKMGVGHTFFPRKVQGAVTISNSEIGVGSLFIAPGSFELQCTNYATYRDEGYSKLHIGRKNGAEEGISRYLTDETKRIEDAAVWSKVRDVLRAVMDGRVLDEIVGKLVDARGDVIEGDPVKVIEAFAKKNSFTEAQKGGLLKHFTNSGEASRFGMHWAVTRLSQDEEDYDEASRLERLGGEVIELPKHDWEVLAKAA